MAIKQRGRVWWYEFTLNGKSYRGSCKTQDEHQAQEYHDKVKAAAWRQSVVGEKVRRTWGETLKRWLGEHENKKSYVDDTRYAAFWTEEFARAGVVYLDQITPDAVSKIRDAEVGRKHKRSVNVERVISKNTVNRKLALLRSVINAAHAEYLWLETRPLFRGFTENNEIVRFLEPHEFERLHKALPSPYNRMALFAVSTGLRFANVGGLRWEYVNLARRTVTFPSTLMKNGKPFSVALNSSATDVVRAQLGASDEWVFPSSTGGRIPSIPSKMWKKALRDSGIENFRWHDLRHTWASWLRQSGKVGLDVIQEMGGWKSAVMVQRYAHMSVEHLAQSASVLDGVLNPSHSAFAQISHNRGVL